MIKTAEQFEFVISELADPPKPKMMFQEFVLHDQLECRTPAKPRMLRLINEMTAAGIEARNTESPIQLPARMLPDPQAGFSLVPESFELQSLYSNNNAFANREVDQLKIELAAAIKRLDQLPAELVKKNHHIVALNERLDRARARILELRERMAAIRKHFGV